MKPTLEQAHAISIARSGRPLALEAMAGTGKSSTLKMIANAMPAKKMLYTAFSAAVINDARLGGFGSTRIQSNHSLAYSKFGAAYRDARRMERRLTPRVVVDVLGLKEGQFSPELKTESVAHLALEAVIRFQQSADQVLELHHVKIPGSVKKDAAPLVLGLACRIWDALTDMQSPMPVTHDTYLKRWALMNPRLPFDVIMLDEAQDANAVIVDVLSKQSAQLIIVGDQSQQIFSWRGAVNAMAAFPIKERACLTQSFRFGPTIAEAANAVLSAHAGSERFVRGNPEIRDRIGDFATEKGPHTEIARKNATLIGRVTDCVKMGRVAVVGGVNELLLLVDGAEKLQRGELALTSPDLMDFKAWDEVKQYADSDSGRDLKVFVSLVEKYGTYRLTQILNGVKDNEKDESRCDVILTTAHRSKGREWERVVIHDDFPVPEDSDLGISRPEGSGEGISAEGGAKESSGWRPEEANLLYVAVTRAKQVLNIEANTAWRDAVDRCIETGVDLPGVTDDPRFNPEAIEMARAEADRSMTELDGDTSLTRQNLTGVLALMQETAEKMQTLLTDWDAYQWPLADKLAKLEEYRLLLRGGQAAVEGACFADVVDR